MFLAMASVNQIWWRLLINWRERRRRYCSSAVDPYSRADEPPRPNERSLNLTEDSIITATRSERKPIMKTGVKTRKRGEEDQIVNTDHQRNWETMLDERVKVGKKASRRINGQHHRSKTPNWKKQNVDCRWIRRWQNIRMVPTVDEWRLGRQHRDKLMASTIDPIHRIGRNKTLTADESDDDRIFGWYRRTEDERSWR